MLIFLYIDIKHFQHLEMRKKNSKLNFTKNRQATKNLKFHSPDWASAQKVRLYH